MLVTMCPICKTLKNRSNQGVGIGLRKPGIRKLAV